MILLTTILTFIGVALAKLAGLLIVPWPVVFSVIFIVPLVYIAMIILQLSAIQYIEDWDDDK